MRLINRVAGGDKDSSAPKPESHRVEHGGAPSVSTETGAGIPGSGLAGRTIMTDSAGC